VRRLVGFGFVNVGMALLLSGCSARPPIIEATPNGAVVRNAR